MKAIFTRLNRLPIPLWLSPVMFAANGAPVSISVTLIQNPALARDRASPPVREKQLTGGSTMIHT